MPLGLILIIAVSIVVYRRARSVGRNRYLWVVLFWVITLGFGFMGAFVGGFLALLDTPLDDLTDDQVKTAAIGPAAVGMIIGTLITFWACGRRVANKPVLEESRESRDG